MLVGAPKANTSQPGVLQGGAVYLCPWGTSPAQCTPIEFDSKGNPLRRSGRFREGLRGGAEARGRGPGGVWSEGRSLTSSPATCSEALGLQLRAAVQRLPVALTPRSQSSPAQPKEGGHDSETCGSHFP